LIIIMIPYVAPAYPGFSTYSGYQYAPCDPKEDARALHKAFKGLGTDEKTVILILANRSKQQLDEINREYKEQSSSHHTLEQGLKSELSGNFLKLALGLITPTLIYKKDTLREACEGLGTRDSALVDVFTQATTFELAEFAKDDKLRRLVLDDVSGDYKKVIEELLQARRPEFGTISEQQAEEVAHRFYKAGEGKIGTDESEYTRIITQHSPEALHMVDHVYKQKHKHGLKKAVQKETSFNYKNMLVGLLTPRHEYFAHVLHKAIAGAGTDDRKLVYVFSVLDRGELSFVAEAYVAKYKKSLKDAVKGDTSGDYRSLLLALL